MVYGPSLTSETIMWAPKTPFAVGTPRRSSADPELLDQSLRGRRDRLRR